MGYVLTLATGGGQASVWHTATACLAPLAQRMIAGTQGAHSRPTRSPSARTARAVRSTRHGANVAPPVREHTRKASAVRPNYT